jgi:hypothetical protein
MRLTAGSISRAGSDHFSLRSIKENPVRLPPGLLKLVTRPEPTGSPDMKTMGLVGAARCVARVAGVDPVSRKTLRGIAEQFQTWLKGWAGKRNIPVMEAPQGRRNEFVDPCKPDRRNARTDHRR